MTTQELMEERVKIAYKQGCIDKEMHGLDMYKKGFAAGKLQGMVDLSAKLLNQTPNENNTHKTE